MKKASSKNNGSSTIKTNNLFNTDNKMELIYELIEIFDLFHLEQIEYSQINLPSASKEKITAIINLYQSLNKNIPQHKYYILNRSMFS